MIANRFDVRDSSLADFEKFKYMQSGITQGGRPSFFLVIPQPDHLHGKRRFCLLSIEKDYSTAAFVFRTTLGLGELHD
jgi:hypothetical protein